MRRRSLERIAFGAHDLDVVIAAMTRLSMAGDGWINLVPTLAGADEERSTSLRFFTLLGGGGMGMTMATWVPADRREQPGRPRLGIAHVAGRRVVALLALRSAPVPDSWVIEQDHPGRGLLVRPPSDEANETVLTWALKAIAQLSAPARIERWRADVYEPGSYEGNR
jgi:hypothetical protein